MRALLDDLALIYSTRSMVLKYLQSLNLQYLIPDFCCRYPFSHVRI